MNILLYELARGDLNGDSVKIEDNIGESIHIHIGRLRIEMAVDEFRTLVDEFDNAAEVIQDGNC